jgi:hypothetical protein
VGYLYEKDDEDDLNLDLDLKACSICRRELLPWQEQCPDDGGAPVPKGELNPTFDPQLARFQMLEAKRAEDEAPEDQSD